MTTYKFQCNRCFIVSGHMSSNPNDAPTCCGGEKMVAIPIPEAEPYGFGMVVRLSANRYRKEHLCVLTTEGTQVAGSGNVWRYYAMTLDRPYMIFKIYSDDFVKVEPEFCILPQFVPGMDKDNPPGYDATLQLVLAHLEELGEPIV